MLFRGGDRFRARQRASAASFLAMLDNGTVLGFGVGLLFGGALDRGAERWTIDPGVVWSLNVGRRFFGREPAIPFLLVAGTFSGSSTRTRRLSDGERAPLHALDAKLDLSVGWTLGEAFSPYVSVRGFGGPIFWRIDGERTLGSDLYHVSFAVGFNLTLANRVSAYFDGAFWGMRGLGGGVSVRF